MAVSGYPKPIWGTLPAGGNPNPTDCGYCLKPAPVGAPNPIYFGGAYCDYPNPAPKVIGPDIYNMYVKLYNNTINYTSVNSEEVVLQTLLCCNSICGVPLEHLCE